MLCYFHFAHFLEKENLCHDGTIAYSLPFTLRNTASQEVLILHDVATGKRDLRSRETVPATVAHFPIKSLPALRCDDRCCFEVFTS